MPRRIPHRSLACLVAIATTGLAVPTFAAETTIYEKRTFEEQRHSLEVKPPATKVEERTTVEKIPVQPPVIEKRTKTVVSGDADDSETDAEVEEGNE
jgi:hypothetical protein